MVPIKKKRIPDQKYIIGPMMSPEEKRFTYTKGYMSRKRKKDEENLFVKGSGFDGWKKR